MYSYLNGKVTEVYPSSITVDINDIGYKVITPNPYEFTLNEIFKIYIHHYVREDLIQLFGFKTFDEKNLFVKLLSVKGIGPKSAIAILASGNVNDVIGAIEIGNVKFLSKFPGIGPKASQQIVLDLKGKLDLSENIKAKSNAITEVEEALKSLGYKSREITKVTKDLDPKGKTEELLKAALSKMLN